MKHVITRKETAISPDLRNYYIVVSDSKNQSERIIGRRITTIDEINKQAEWIWSLFRPSERKTVRVLVQGDLEERDRFFDSDLLN